MSLGSRLVASNLRAQSDSSGGALTIAIELGGGGGQAKTAKYSLRIKASSGANVRIWVEFLDGPDGRTFDTHSDIIGTSGTPVALSSTDLMSGDADQDIILNEYRVLQITISDSAASSLQWVMFDLYEMLKPF